MKSKILLSISALAIAISSTSCLKDDDYALDPKNAHNVIEWKEPSMPTSSYVDKYTVYIPKTLENVPEDELELGINWAGPERFAPQDITVTLEANPAAATAAGYVQITPDVYEMPATATIKKGETVGRFKVKLKPNKFNGDLSNGLAITIKSSTFGIVSGNNGTIIIGMPVKNPYDGSYKILSGYVQRYTAPGSPTSGDALNGTLVGNDNLILSTINSNTVEVSNLKWYGNSSGVAGIDKLRIKVDPETNKVTMLSIGNATLANIAGKENNYDPVTKTFTLNFDWNQTAAAREITDLKIQWEKNR